MQPETHYARSGDLHIAYQVVGEGPGDLVLVPSWFSHLEVMWQEPLIERLLQGLASFSRLILFDQRGTGMSDPVPLGNPPTLEERADDIRAVMAAAGSERTAVVGATLGAQLGAVFAACHPELVSALVLYNTSARYVRNDDYPIGAAPEFIELAVEMLSRFWGTPDPASPWLAGANERLRNSVAYYQRMAMSPGAAAALYRANLLVDIRDVLPTIRVPTLVIHARDNRLVPPEHGRFLADHIPDARYVEVPSTDIGWFMDDMLPALGEIAEFLGGALPPAEPHRVLATVLFTDLVRSTETAAAQGDRTWRDVLDVHGAMLHRQVERYNGRVVKTTGDGILATFDGPARAIRSAVAIRDAVRRLGLEARAGLHTGEIELLEDDVAGIAVHIAARVMGLAGAGEVFVSSTVRDLVAGSGIAFKDRGVRTLKGVPGAWRVFAVEA